MNIFSILLTIVNLISNPPDIDTVTSLDLKKYEGTWYQVYDNNYNKLFISNGECIKHNYYYNYHTLLHVTYNDLNTENKTVNTLSSELVRRNSSEPGKFDFKFNNFIGNNYYVTKVGPIIDDKYDYAVVTDNLGLSLFVLTRDLEKFKNIYKNEIDEFINKTYDNDEVIEYLTHPQEVENIDCKIFI